MQILPRSKCRTSIGHNQLLLLRQPCQTSLCLVALLFKLIKAAEWDGDVKSNDYPPVSNKGHRQSRNTYCLYHGPSRSTCGTLRGQPHLNSEHQFRWIVIRCLCKAQSSPGVGYRRESLTEAIPATGRKEKEGTCPSVEAQLLPAEARSLPAEAPGSLLGNRLDVSS